MVRIASIFAAAGLAAFAIGVHADNHAHVVTEAERAERRLFVANAKHALGQCEGSESMRALQERAAARRLATINKARRQRRLTLSEFLATDHESSLDVSASTSASTLFGDEVACILQPEVTYGPYYVDGEYIRTDVREDQPGFDLYFDLQVINVETCEPIEDVYFDFWHANLTGVYSGVVASDNGNGDDATNINTTFFRGVQPTDEDGVVQFISKFPGHYTGRTTHLHLMANYGGTVLENGTYAGGYIPHVGQFFFDQDLLTTVYATDLYAQNTYELTLNEDDSMLAEVSSGDYDALVEYALLGDSVEDGIFAWISVAMNLTASQSVSPAAYLTASGGVSASTTTGGGGGGMGGGSFGGGSFSGGSAGGFGGSAAGGAPSQGVAGSVSGSVEGEAADVGSVAGEADTTTTACNVRS